MRSSDIIFWLAESRTSFDGYSIQEKTTASSAFACTARRKSVTLPSGTSSAQASTWRSAPNSLNSGQAMAAILRYCSLLAFGTARMNPST
jgi:hypothetical protein